VQILGLPFFESQGKWIAQLLSGKKVLPSYQEMMKSIEEFYHSKETAGIPKRHTHEIEDFEVKVSFWFWYLLQHANVSDIHITDKLVFAVLWQIWRKCWISKVGRVEKRVDRIFHSELLCQLGDLSWFMVWWWEASRSSSNSILHSTSTSFFLKPNLLTKFVYFYF